MLRKKVVKILLALLSLRLKDILSLPLPYDEEIDLHNSRLLYYSQRFRNILKTLNPVYSKDLLSLISEFDAAQLASVNLADKQKLLENYNKRLTNDFSEELQLKLDEQYLNEDILMEEWYLSQLLKQLQPNLAHEVAEILPLYQLALNAKELDEKYELFAIIEEKFSQELSALLEEQPESIELLNVHLVFFKEFLQFLLKNDEKTKNSRGKQFIEDIRSLLRDVEKALESSEKEIKFAIIDRFDDIENPFGRFLSYKIDEFEIYKFSV